MNNLRKAKEYAKRHNFDVFSLDDSSVTFRGRYFDIDYNEAHGDVVISSYGNPDIILSMLEEELYYVKKLKNWLESEMSRAIIANHA